MNRKRQQRKTLAIIIAFIVLIAALAFFVYQAVTLNEKSGQLQAQIDANTQNVYVAVADISAGEEITSDNVASQQIVSGLEAFNYITADQIGAHATVDIPEGCPIQYNMITEEEFDTDSREYEVQVANLMTTQADFDTIDIRIMYPNGEDYLILSKKTITGLNLEGCVFNVVLNEEEILRMASATVDAYLTTGAYIYTTRYVANSQDEAKPTYLVRAETLDLINSDPNVLTKATETLNLTARLSLEARLSGMTEDQLEAVASGHNIADTAGGSTASSTGATDSYETTEEGEDGEDVGVTDMNEITDKTEDTLKEE